MKTKSEIRNQKSEINDFRHGILLRSITFPQLGGAKIIGRKDCSHKMPTIVTGWPAAQRELLFQSLN